jgi:hypothetical protein
MDPTTVQYRRRYGGRAMLPYALREDISIVCTMVCAVLDDALCRYGRLIPVMVRIEIPQQFTVLRSRSNGQRKKMYG